MQLSSPNSFHTTDQNQDECSETTLPCKVVCCALQHPILVPLHHKEVTVFAASLKKLEGDDAVSFNTQEEKKIRW